MTNLTTNDNTPPCADEVWDEAFSKRFILKYLDLRWFLCIALRIPTAHDFRVISARKLARARTQRKKFHSS